ncbi:hypothetical protein HMPREF0293_1971 [Corynebacterium glucuronolyticum ATCC 51866]|uniref:Uncharacterized protein n=1 Tax=Corynebacterium glucuronolyticum ATCC 51866 TaxID=548478 RepID=A0ABM9XNW5_9CORY|nr:hypothetical protein HMPREF0293_1971 [Corynebacterium glucuronolyticum ATCC 51866]
MLLFSPIFSAKTRAVDHPCCIVEETTYEHAKFRTKYTKWSALHFC